MTKRITLTLMLVALAVPAMAQERTWRSDVKPLFDAKCIQCHEATAPEYNDWELLDEKVRDETPPRMDTYPHFMSYVVWPATGAMMRRLDDGKTSGKAGNMHQYLGDSDEERGKNLQIIKEWLGDGAWNMNRWQARNEVPGISKEQLEKIKAKY
ncbi:MAG: cytochrome C [Desulfobulbaceae bacterium]|nr:cytochrome C [Desulfobulbaceae bacterium]